MEEIILEDGTVVRMQPVPSMMISEIVNDDPELAELPIPIVEVPSVAGHTEKVTARVGEPVYAEWFQENERRRKLRDQAFGDYTWYYGVIEWKRPGDNEFTDQVPKDWKFPKKLIALGRKPRKDEIGRVLDYIKVELFALPADQEKGQKVMYGPVRPITREEVETVKALFPGDEMETAAS